MGCALLPSRCDILPSLQGLLLRFLTKEGNPRHKSTTASPGLALFKAACSLEARYQLDLGWEFPLFARAAPLPLCHPSFLISTWTLDRDQDCRHPGKEEPFMGMTTPLGQAQSWLKQRLKAPAETRPVCFSPNGESFTAVGLFASEKPCAPNPVTRPGAKLEQAVNACLLIKGFNHAAWTKRAHAELGNGPLFPPAPQINQRRALPCPGAAGTVQLSVPAHLARAHRGRGSLELPGLHGAGRRKLPQFLQGKQLTRAGFLPLRLQMPDVTQEAPQTHGNGSPKPKRKRAGAVKELEPADREEPAFPPPQLPPPSSSFQPVCPHPFSPVSSTGGVAAEDVPAP